MNIIKESYCRSSKESNPFLSCIVKRLSVAIHDTETRNEEQNHDGWTFSGEVTFHIETVRYVKMTQQMLQRRHHLQDFKTWILNFQQTLKAAHQIT